MVDRHQRLLRRHPLASALPDAAHALNVAAPVTGVLLPGVVQPDAGTVRLDGVPPHVLTYWSMQDSPIRAAGDGSRDGT